MRLSKWFQPPRRLLAMFFASTLVSACALGFLGWQLVDQDRVLAHDRLRKARGDAADLGVAALQKHLSAVEEKLTVLANSEEAAVAEQAVAYADTLHGDAALLVLRKAAMDAFPTGRLVYYPVVPDFTEAPEAAFDEADANEFLKKDYRGAISVLQRLSFSPDPAIKADALARLGRNLRNAGRGPEAIAAYTQLAQAGPTPVGLNREPAALLARGALCDIFEERNDPVRVRDEAQSLYSDLRDGRWQPNRGVYYSRVNQAMRLLGPSAPALPTPGHVALAEAAQSLWDDWQSKTELPQRRTIWTEDQSVLLVTRSSRERAVALIAAPSYVESAWMTEVSAIADSRNARIALTDMEDHPVVGRVNAPDDEQSRRLRSNTGLPWTLSAITNPGAVGDRALTLTNRLVVAGLIAMALLVVGGGYLTGRAVARELAVARLESDFVSAVSHEFRTPLTALRQLSELLARGRVVNEDTRQQCYETLEQESTRLQRLVEGLLKFGRMEAGAMQYEFETIDAAALARSLTDEFGRHAERRGYHVECSVDDVAQPVRADREALGCVLWNLLDNAVKYSPDCRTVWLDLARENGSVAIRVRDQGVGIPRADRQRIFEKFVRGDAANTLAVEGTGIGLAVARRIVATHGGEIRLESEPGAGSTFTVLLPVVES